MCCSFLWLNFLFLQARNEQKLTHTERKKVKIMIKNVNRSKSSVESEIETACRI